MGCEAAGKGLHTTQHAATICKGSLGIFHGMKSYFCQDEYSQIAPSMSEDAVIVINLSGRGDKDVAAIARYMGGNL